MAALPVRVVVAGDVSEVTKARQTFTRDLIPSLALLGVVLAAATWIQIGLGLRPLQRVRTGIAAIRKGEAAQLDEEAPSEVAPLVEEINGLIAAQAREIERSRARAGDLAHGLKTPLAALAADVRALEDKGEIAVARRIADVGEAMRRHVERELARARIHGARSLGAVRTTRVAPLVATLLTMQQRSLSGSRLSFENACSADADIAMDKVDLAEVLGNLIENAARHARSRVRVSTLADGRVAVEDDGPGIPPEKRASVVVRGERLDSSAGGTGLGLAIVSEVLSAYDRKLVLDGSPLGGLRAEF